jgi:hypothetical protein
MAKRVNCNILQSSNLARRRSVLTTENRRARGNRGGQDTSARRGRVNKCEDVPFAAKVSRKWDSAKDRVLGIFDVYKWLDEIPLGLLIDVWA